MRLENESGESVRARPDGKDPLPCEAARGVAETVAVVRSVFQRQQGYKPSAFGSISNYGVGVQLDASVKVRGRKGRKGGGKRGKIKGWSSASRRRMREFLLCQGEPEGWHVFGVTCTVPGPVCSVEEYKRVFDRFRDWLRKAGHAAVWRLEVQQRGALHWHLLCIVRPDGVPFRESWEKYHEKMRSAVQRVCFQEGCREAWASALDSLGKSECVVNLPGGRQRRDERLRSRFPGARAHACDVQASEGARGAWLRYLQDHATKRKQGQVGSGFGRHWGVINRKAFAARLPSESVSMDRGEWVVFLRAFQRMCTPRIPCDKAPFGCRLGWRNSRGRIGKSVWFSRPESVMRLVEWAKRESADRRIVNGGHLRSVFAV